MSLGLGLELLEPPAGISLLTSRGLGAAKEVKIEREGLAVKDERRQAV